MLLWVIVVEYVLFQLKEYREFYLYLDVAYDNTFAEDISKIVLKDQTLNDISLSRNPFGSVHRLGLRLK